jgi:hypothetical protein
MNKRVAISAIRRAAASRKAGYLDAVLQASKNTSATHVELTPQDFADLRERFAIEPIGGPGTELSALLKRFGIEPTPTCACRSKATQMDAWGCEECSKPERIDEVVAVMRAEAEARGLPFLDLPARLLVKRAISNARRKEAAANAQRPPHHDRGEEMAPPVHDAQG